MENLNMKRCGILFITVITGLFALFLLQKRRKEN